MRKFFGRFAILMEFSILFVLVEDMCHGIIGLNLEYHLGGYDATTNIEWLNAKLYKY